MNKLNAAKYLSTGPDLETRRGPSTGGEGSRESPLGQHFCTAMPVASPAFKICSLHLPPWPVAQPDSKLLNLSYVLILLSMGHNSLVFSDKADNEAISL